MKVELANLPPPPRRYVRREVDDSFEPAVRKWLRVEYPPVDRLHLQ